MCCTVCKKKVYIKDPLLLDIQWIFMNQYTLVEGRKEMFYLTIHSTHFIYGYMVSDMVKDHSDSKR